MDVQMIVYAGVKVGMLEGTTGAKKLK